MLQEELGELTQKYLMLTKRGRQKGLTEEEIRKQVELELVDVLCCTLLCPEIKTTPFIV